ncbi:MAG: hypothetical protein V7754_11695 [Halioglobus sp.]
MADDYKVSYSYQTGSDSPAAPPAAPDQTLYAFINCERVDLQNGTVLLMDKGSDRQLIVAPEVPVALSHCQHFRTLQEHATLITSRIPQLAGQQENVSQVLKMVLDAGLLTRADTLCQNLNALADKPTLLAPTRVFVITCDRPAAVVRLLETMQHAGNLSDHEQLCLVDDSRQADNADKNREAVAKFNLGSPKNMLYLGPDEQRQMMTKLISALPEHRQAIEFLMDRERWAQQKSYGLARTMCLLMSVGKRCVVMDDDVISIAMNPPQRKPGIQFGSTTREAEFYDSEQAMRAVVASRAEVEPLTGHAQCLGMGLAEATRRLGVDALQADSLRGANGAFLGTLNADSPVLITQSGTLGDPGTSSSHWLLHLDPQSIQRMLAAPGGLSSARNNRFNWLGRRSPTFSKLAVISQVTGLDNSQMLPPYFPVFRGEDYLFGGMVEYLHPEAVVLEYDWAVPHHPVEAHNIESEEHRVAATGNLSSIARYITDRTSYQPGISVETRLASLALLLQQLAESSSDSLLALYRAELANTRAEQLAGVTRHLQATDPSQQEWVTYLQSAAAEINSALQQAASPKAIKGVAEAMDEEEVLQKMKAYTGQYAASLQAWPLIREAARDISGQMLEAGELAP